MPRIPLILEDQPLAISGGPTPNAAAWAAPAEALGQAGQEIQRAGQVFAEVKARATKAAATLDLQQTLDRMKVEYADAVVRTKQNPNVRPDQYAATLDAEMGRIRHRAGAEFVSRFPAYGADFDTKASQFAAPQAVDARHEGLRRLTEQTQAAASLNLQRFANDLAQTDNPDLQRDILRQVHEIFSTMSGTNSWTGEQTAAAVKGFYGDVEEATARRKFNDPTHRLDVIRTLNEGLGSHMSVLRRMNLAHSLTTQWTAEQKEAERQAEKQMEEARESAMSSLAAKAIRPDKNPSALLIELEQSRQAFGFKDTAVIRLNNLITKAPDETPSDPETRARLIASIHTTRPSVTFASLDAAYDRFRAGQPGVNTADWLELRNKLTARIDHNEALLRADRSEARGIAHYNHAEAERQLRAALAIPDIIPDKFDPKRLTTYADLLGELSRRSNAFGGGEDPLLAVADIIKRGQGRLELDAKMRDADLAAQLKFPADDLATAIRDLEAAKSQGYGPGKRLGSQADYDNQRRIILELAERQRARIRQSLDGASPNPRQGGASTPESSPFPEPSEEKYAPEYRRPTRTGEGGRFGGER